MNNLDKIRDKIDDALIEFDKDEKLALIRLTFSKDELLNMSNTIEKQNVLEKKVAKKPSMDNMGIYYCPNCNVWINYSDVGGRIDCRVCSQILDWGC